MSIYFDSADVSDIVWLERWSIRQFASGGQHFVGYRELLTVARGWASEFSRTTVKICAGEFIREIELPTVCTGVAEIDPRKNIWRRAMEALQEGANLRPAGPFCRAKAATVFVSRSTAGKPGELMEARLDVIVIRGLAHTGVVTGNAPRCDLSPVSVEKVDDVVTVVRKILAACGRKYAYTLNALRSSGGFQHVTRMPPKPSVSLSALVVALNRSRRRDFGAASFERKSSLGTIWLSRTGMANQE